MTRIGSIIISLLLLCLAIAGCAQSRPPGVATAGEIPDCYKKTIEGHDYLVFRISSG